MKTLERPERRAVVRGFSSNGKPASNGPSLSKPQEANQPKSKQSAISRPVAYGALIVLSMAVVWASGGDSTKPQVRTQHKVSTKKISEQPWDFIRSEKPVVFEAPTSGISDAFRPLIFVDRKHLRVQEEELMKVPANLAQGEGNWTYTGMVEVNGERLALLENAALHQGGYVKEGETWKKSKIVSITSASIVMSGTDGVQETVYRFNPDQVPKPKPPPDSGFRPLDPSSALKGPIGSGLQITGESSQETRRPVFNPDK